MDGYALRVAHLRVGRSWDLFAMAAVIPARLAALQTAIVPEILPRVDHKRASPPRTSTPIRTGRAACAEAPLGDHIRLPVLPVLFWSERVSPIGKVLPPRVGIDPPCLRVAIDLWPAVQVLRLLGAGLRRGSTLLPACWGALLLMPVRALCPLRPRPGGLRLLRGGWRRRRPRRRLCWPPGRWHGYRRRGRRRRGAHRSGRCTAPWAVPVDLEVPDAEAVVRVGARQAEHPHPPGAPTGGDLRDDRARGASQVCKDRPMLSVDADLQAIAPCVGALPLNLNAVQQARAPEVHLEVLNVTVPRRPPRPIIAVYGA
mmetsp:Transcript_37330/g.101021  ORF Transcript_37330/g.101021 Transcript_37330/m.101021 type:complete len:314 (-) Transcript_37330:379-1320(-)